MLVTSRQPISHLPSCFRGMCGKIENRNTRRANRLEHKRSTLGLLVTTQLEVLASLQRQL